MQEYGYFKPYLDKITGIWLIVQILGYNRIMTTKSLNQYYLLV